MSSLLYIAEQAAPNPDYAAIFPHKALHSNGAELSECRNTQQRASAHVSAAVDGNPP